MRVLYVAPRFHTNQIPVVKGWLENGHQVLFLSQFAGTSEDYSVLKPIVLGYSVVFEGIMQLQKWLFHRGHQSVKQEYDIRSKMGFPPFFRMRRLIREFLPELVILRERAVYNIPVYLYCRSLKICCLLYNQSPVWDYVDRDRGKLHRILLHFLPRKRITPVLGTPGNGKIKMPESYFVPFVAEPHMSPKEKSYFVDGRIRVLCVARYEERKQLFLLLEAAKELFKKYRLKLVVAGEAVEESQKWYYEKLSRVVQDAGLGEYVELLKNLSVSQVYKEYEKADLFVLPSTKERASISQLEAMGCSVPVICSDTNGSACYVEHGKNGYLFRDSDSLDLKEKIEWIISDRERLTRMGEKSFHFVENKYDFYNYYKGVLAAAGMTGQEKW